MGDVVMFDPRAMDPSTQRLIALCEVHCPRLHSAAERLQNLVEAMDASGPGLALGQQIRIRAAMATLGELLRWHMARVELYQAELKRRRCQVNSLAEVMDGVSALRLLADVAAEVDAQENARP